MRALVVYASRHGSTMGIADRMAEILRSLDVDAIAVEAASAPDPGPYDACIVGSGVYIGSWLKDGVRYLERHAVSLAARPVWLFSSGPLKGSSAGAARDDDPLTQALGPLAGPGSGGRRRIAELTDAIRPRGHRVFLGAYDPADPPRTISERLVRLMPASKDLLPPGDFRPWDEIDGWVREIGAALAEEAANPVPVG
jgi:menaquinone-dependent protoporphyrinogen oxidase